MRRMQRSDEDDSPPGRGRRLVWRRLAVLVVAPLLALAGASATAQGIWVTVAPMPTPRAGLAGAAAECPDGLYGTCVYVAGGAKFEAYRPASTTWSTLPPLKTPRDSVASATAPCPGDGHGDCVYAFGGVSGGPSLATAEAYGTQTNTWLTLPPMPAGGRQSAAAATAPCAEGLGLRGTCVYVFGGRNTALPGPSQILNLVEAYSPATNTWATVTPMQTPRVGHGGAAAPCPAGLGLRGTCVYAVASGAFGVNASQSVEVYSPLLNQWMDAPDIPTGRNFLAAATAPCPEGMTDGCVYALGGRSETGATLTTVEAYSPVTNAWTTMPPMPTPHRSLAGAAAPCPRHRENRCVYAIGGLVDSGPNPTDTAEAFAIERAERWTGGALTHPPQG
ncbi:hypothetical protein J7I97_21815 [Streptomyces sp. ISL-87]|nr:hypothetical protein [Streptomyces sp. ISL-87]